MALADRESVNYVTAEHGECDTLPLSVRSAETISQFSLIKTTYLYYRYNLAYP